MKINFLSTFLIYFLLGFLLKLDC